MACKCCHSWAASEDSDDNEKKERWAFWFAGFGSGPDTVNGTWWSVAILALAVGDSICGTNPADGLTSGANDLACTPVKNWNQTAFTAFNGSSCYKLVGLQTAYHNLPDATCQSAFADYRVHTKALGAEFTCNCSQTSPYAFLGGTGGTRPSNVLSYASAFTNIFIALILPIVGAMVDTGDNRRQVFLMGGLGCGIATVLGSILGTNMLWAVGLTFTVMTAIFYEIMFLGLAPYLPEVAHNDEGRGRVAGFRQCASLSAQLLFVIIIGVIVGLIVLPNKPIATAISGNVLCCLWVCICIPLAYAGLGDRKATQTRTSNVIVHAFRELFHTFKAAKKYPQTFMFLLMHSMASSGVGSVITQLPTYSVAQLGLDGFQISVLVVCILLFAIPAAIIYATCCASRCKPKTIQLGSIVWFIIFTLYFGLVVNGPGKFVPAVIGAIIGGIGFGVWYSMNTAHFMKLIPMDQKAEFVGLFSFCGYLPRFLPPLVYSGIVEGLNDHTAAFLSLLIWFVLGLILCFFIDFDKGEKDANAGTKVVNKQLDGDITTEKVAVDNIETEVPADTAEE